MHKYKVALVSDWYYPKAGGVEYSVDSLARNLQSLGHEVHIITKGYDRISWKESLPVIRLKGKVFSERLISPSAYKALYHILKRENYDLVHAHGLDSPLAILSLVIARMAGIPRLMTNHSLMGNVLRKRPVLIATRLSLKLANAVIAVSSAVEQESKSLFKGALYRIPNGIDLRSPNGKAQSIAIDVKGKIAITTVSRMTKRKGVQELIPIAVKLLKKYDNLLFLMVGDGPLREELENKIKELNLSQNFLFTGEVSRETVFNLLDKTDIFVLPSRQEAFGVVILEAFLKKVSVVARNHSGVSDLITHGKTGLLADDNDQVVRYIEELITKPQFAESLSTAAHQELSRYQWRNIAEQIENVYSAVLDAKASGILSK